MAYTYKVIAQSAPSATTNTDIYTVGAGKQAIISTITICNRAGTSSTYRIAIRPAGNTLANQHYLAYDTTIVGNDTISLTLGLSLAATDVITVYSSTTNLTFNAYGAEIS
jgi:hypothetical protein